MDEIRIQLITYNVGTWAPVAGKTDISAILPSAGPTPGKCLNIYIAGFFDIIVCEGEFSPVI